MLATRRGVAVVRRASPQAANDNVPGTITPDDAPFFLALALICVGLIVLATYALMSGPDDVVALLRR